MNSFDPNNLANQFDKLDKKICELRDSIEKKIDEKIDGLRDSSFVNQTRTEADLQILTRDIQEIKNDLSADVQNIKADYINPLKTDLDSLKNNLFGIGTMIGIAGLVLTIVIPFIFAIIDLNNKISMLDKDSKAKITTISTEVQSKSQVIDELNSKVDKLTGKEDKSILSTKKGWSSYQGLKVTNDDKNQGVIFNGEVTTEGAGYSKESSVEFKTFGEKILSLNIENSSQSTFDGQKMLKLEVNGKPLIPQENSRVNVEDGTYINSGDGTVNFQLPLEVQKIEFVFYNADVKNLKVSAKIR
jgi:hypothetical protein